MTQKDLTTEEKIVAALESFTQGGQGTLFNFTPSFFIHNYGLDATEEEVERVYAEWDYQRIKKEKKLRKLCAYM
jgi:hypothetical protein